MLLESLTNLRVVSSLDGQQSGEHFGASLVVFDINNDGRDDIIIGAPHYTNYKTPEIMFDVGAVYVYYQTTRGTYERGLPNELIMKGQTSGAQFGFAVAGLGDTNADGFNDLAVGAPYENDGTGAVYIFHGSDKGLRSTPGQIISGKTFNPSMSSFGFSFNNGASDFDTNQYNDIIVGAYQSDTVIYLPARPVVRVASSITFTPEYITFEKKNCEISSVTAGSVPVACVLLQYCLNYNGVGVSQNVDVNITITLDVKQPKSNRLLFLKTHDFKKTQLFALTLSTQFCQEEFVYLKPDVRDKLSPIDVTLVPYLVQTTGPLAPVLDIYSGNGYASKPLSIFRDCGPDLICIPDLRLTIST